MPDSVNFKINIARDDYVRASRVVLMRGKFMMAYWFLFTLFVVLVVLGRVQLVMEGELSGYSHWLGILALVGIQLIWTFQMFFLSPHLDARAHSNTDKVDDVTMDQNGIVENNATLASQYSWQLFTAAVEKKDAFFIFRGDVSYHFYPKWSLSTDIVDRVREIIRVHVPKAKLRKIDRNSSDRPDLEENAVPIEEDLPASSNLIAAFQTSYDGLNFRVNLKTADYIGGFRAIIFANRWIQLSLAFFVLIVLCCLYKKISIFLYSSDIKPFLLSFTIFSLIFFSIYYVYPNWRMRSAPIHEGECDIRAGEIGIEIRNRLETTSIRWQKFARAFETKNWFLLVRRDALFHIFPKRELSTDDADRFRELVGARIPKARLLN